MLLKCFWVDGSSKNSNVVHFSYIKTFSRSKECSIAGMPDQIQICAGFLV